MLYQVTELSLFGQVHQKEVSCISQLIHIKIWLEEETIIIGRTFNTRTEFPNGSLSTMVIQRIKLKQMFMSNGLTQKTHSHTKKQTIIMHHNFMCSQVEISISQDTVVRFHMSDSTQEMELMLKTTDLTILKIYLPSNQDKINYSRKMMLLFPMFLIRMCLLMDSNKRTQLWINKVQVKMLWKNMVMDFG